MMNDGRNNKAVIGCLSWIKLEVAKVRRLQEYVTLVLAMQKCRFPYYDYRLCGEKRDRPDIRGIATIPLRSAETVNGWGFVDGMGFAVG